MSTRAVYLFTDAKGPYAQSFMVYKHHDGYPSGAADAITAGRAKAWQGARFEADEAAASFVAGAKTSAGGVRLMHGDLTSAPGDAAYVYLITPKGDDWHVECRETMEEFGDDATLKNTRKLFAGSLPSFVAWAAKA